MTADRGAAPRTLKIAVAGAGPAGCYPTARLLSGEAIEGEVRVDLFDRLPTPYGRVRFGVAPDHPTVERSPSGIIGTNKKYANDAIAPLVADHVVGKLPTRGGPSPHEVGCVLGREHRALPRIGCSPHAHVPPSTYERQDPRR
ncbi:MAG: hypothetical protein M0P31_18635 [Solirubrobacteraceae bacterium]|nr:hypothetical protein [Solirubrobacteraceae bacterium]